MLGALGVRLLDENNDKKELKKRQKIEKLLELKSQLL